MKTDPLDLPLLLDHPDGGAGAPPPPPTRPRSRRRLRRVIGVAVLVLVAPTGVSFGRAMFYPGDAPYSVRAVEWVRDHKGGFVVDTVENWLYRRNAPAATGAPDDRTAGGAATSSTALPKVQLLPGLAPAGGEGKWVQASATADGRVSMYATWLLPDPKHVPVVAAVALLPRTSTQLHQVAGTREPVPGLASPENYQVAASDRSALVATFNAGWKMKDISGGWYGDSREVVPLKDGQASLVIDRQGHARVGAWNQDVRMTSDVVSVRQNLDMVVRDGQPVAGLDHNAGGAWGSAKNQLQYTSRSGVGTDAAGDLIYVAGKDMTLDVLARAMAAAGVVQGMELDIHSQMVTFNYFTPSTTPGAASVPLKLLASMYRAPDRYLAPDQRDFFYVTGG